jgi:hypothetical protein
MVIYCSKEQSATEEDQDEGENTYSLFDVCGSADSLHNSANSAYTDGSFSDCNDFCLADRISL